jgi:beta-ribofuranosylaminobenzene 5'-phosphate synthase
MIRVSAPSRLHFGPFSLPAGDGPLAAWPELDGQPTVPARAFGGVGLMVERPGVTVTVEAAPAWAAEGPLAARALAHAQQVSAALAFDRPLRIIVAGTPHEHVGLGTGTQLGLAIARAVALAGGRTDAPAVDLAPLVGRGRRSALGIHGFAHGGFLVEGGKQSAAAIAPLVARMPFPDEWRVLLVIPRDLQGAHGVREADAFKSLGGTSSDLRRTEALCRLVLLGMLPALAERELNAFGEALYDFNRRVGEMFAPWQHDLYAHPRVATLVKLLRMAGVRGVGQSSWGPTVFAITTRENAVAIGEQLTSTEACRPDELLVTAAANGGARVETLPD